MKINNLRFTFNKTDTPFFDNLNATFSTGKLTFIQGKNGIGKSTLFAILQGIQPKECCLSGTLTLDETSYDLNKPHDFYRHVRTVQQDNKRMIAPHFSFYQNLQLAQLPERPGLQSLKIPQIFATMLDHGNIDMTTPAHLLSGGQRQILAIMMALQKPTRVLLLDEPTAALDNDNAQQVMAFLENITAELNLITLIICHDKELVVTYGHHSCYELVHHNGIRTFSPSLTTIKERYA